MAIKTHARNYGVSIWTLLAGAMLLVVAITVMPHITVVALCSIV
jgi:hypothetical protein